MKISEVGTDFTIKVLQQTVVNDVLEKTNLKSRCPNLKGGLWVLGRIGHTTTSMRTLKMEKWSLFRGLHTGV